jgi:hypothetical protein
LPRSWLPMWPVGRRVGVTDHLSSTLGDEIGIVLADDIEALAPYVILFGNTRVAADEEQRSMSPIVRAIERCLVTELHYGATGKDALEATNIRKRNI